MQPGVVSGAVSELHAAKAALGLTPGVNSPLTTQWFDTSGSGNHGTLTGFTGTPWAGTGTVADPYRLVFPGNAYVALPDLGASEDGIFTFEVWYSATGSSNSLVSEGSTASALPMASFALGSSVANKLGLAYRNDAGVIVHVYDAASSNDGAWHDGVVTCDGSMVRVYRNGSPVGTPAAPPAVPFTLNTTSLGALVRTSISYVTAQIVLARIYPFALTAPQVAQNYAAGPLWAPTISGFPVIGSPIIQGMRV